MGAVDPAEEGTLECEGELLRPNDCLELVRRRSPWNRHRRVERVIVGTHPARADLLMAGAGIFPEHVRIYMPDIEERREIDLLVIEEDSVRVNGRAIEPRDWTPLEGGEILELAGWRFRFENESA